MLVIAGPLLALGILASLAVIVMAFFMPSIAFTQGDTSTGLGAVALLPFLVLYIVQIIIYATIGGLLLWGIYHWNKPSIIIATIISPILVIIFSATIATPFNIHLDASTPLGIAAFCIYAITPLITGMVAYHDLRYRLPKIQALLMANPPQ